MYSMGVFKRLSYIVASLLLVVSISAGLIDHVSALSPNLISNPLVQTASSNPSLPLNWYQGNWGTNSATFSYLNSGYNDSNSLEVQMSDYSSGDAKWYFNPIAVTPGDSYTYSDYYTSTVATDVMAVFVNGSGNTTYVDLGEASASSNWAQYSASFVVPSGTQTATIYHLINSDGSLQTDDFSFTSDSAPSVSITSPSNNSSINGTVELAANASDNSGIASVQFYIDGNAVGSPVTSAPYQTSWNSASVPNGDHSLTAVATNVNGISTTSSAVTLDVSNANPAGGNLIPDPLVNQATPGDSSLPEDWSPYTWGTNSTTFSYSNSGYGGSGSLEVNVTSYTSGDSKWAFNPVPVTQDVQYKFSEYYESNINTQIEAVFNMSDGSIVYQLIGQPQASSTWTNFTTEFSAPLGTVSMTIYHLVQSVGTLTTSDFSLTPYTPTGFNRPIVTLTFDDGYVNQYTETLPLLKQYGFDSTQFIITNEIGQKGYLTNSDILALFQDGNEIASHTVTHSDLTQETPSQVTNELSSSQTTLESIINGGSTNSRGGRGTPTQITNKVTDFAYPYGLYDNSVTAAVEQYYGAARGIEDGLNSKDNFNRYDLKVQNIFDTTTTAQVADWIAQAQATNTWLILCYHSVDPNVNNPVDSGIYNITPAQLSPQLAAIKASGITVETMSQALNEITPQL